MEAMEAIEVFEIVMTMYHDSSIWKEKDWQNEWRSDLAPAIRSLDLEETISFITQLETFVEIQNYDLYSGEVNPVATSFGLALFELPVKFWERIRQLELDEGASFDEGAGFESNKEACSLIKSLSLFSLCSLTSSELTSPNTDFERSVATLLSIRMAEMIKSG